MTIDEAAAQLDVRREPHYHYGRGGTINVEEAHLRDYWRIIRRRLWVPITVVAVVVTLTTLYMLRSPSIYEGKTTVQIDPQNQVVDFKDFALNMGGDDAAYINTELRNLQGQHIAYLVAKGLDLEHNPAFLGGQLIAGAQPILQVAAGETDVQAETVRLEPIIDTLQGGVNITPVRDTRLVEIRFRHSDPDLARRIADQWADQFIFNTLKTRYEANRDSSRFLEKQISDYKLKVREASEKLHNYQRANQFIDFGEKNENMVLKRLSALNSMLLEAEDERKKAQAIYEASKLVKDPGELAEIQKDETVINLGKRLTEANQQKNALLVKYTEEWPEVQVVSEQIKHLETELKSQQRRIYASIETTYRQAVAREGSIRSDYVKQRSEVLDQSDTAVAAKLLQQEIDTNQMMLDKLMESQKQIDVSAAGIQKSNIRITEHSILPRGPVAPKRLNNILLSFALSLIGGIGLVLFLDYINNKVESVEDVDRYLQLAALGVVPMFDTGKARKFLGKGNQKGDSKSLVPVQAKGTSVILTDVEANSPVAESYRQLRTSLLLSSAGHAPRTLLFTSSQPAEGKTTTSVNTAISLAQTGAAVLIVDADLRRPRVHKIFGLKNTGGLCNCLTGEADLSSLIQTAMPNLYVLPVGPLPPNPAELLGSPKMKQLVETFSQNFDYVVIDSPPVASFADSLILSSLVDGVIIVIKGGFTPREMAQRTKSLLQSVGAKILGVVVNQIKLQPHDYYYYSTYYTRYYYGEGSGDKKKGED